MFKFMSKIALCGTLALGSTMAMAGPTKRVVIEAQSPVEHLLMRHFLNEVGGKSGNARTVQRGNNNRLGLRQGGRRNTAVVQQNGNRHRADLRQHGRNNAIGVFQFGDNTRVRSRQGGRNNTRLVFAYPDFNAMSDAQIAATVIGLLD